MRTDFGADRAPELRTRVASEADRIRRAGWLGRRHLGLEAIASVILVGFSRSFSLLGSFLPSPGRVHIRRGSHGDDLPVVGIHTEQLESARMAPGRDQLRGGLEGHRHDPLVAV